MRKSSTRLVSSFLPFTPALLAVILFSVSASKSQSPTNQQQQRPRTVGANQNKSAPPANQQNQQTNEEVGEGDVVRVETRLVTVPAVVTDKTGHPISSLKLENFAVLEDGKPQTLTNFSTTEAPFEIALLLDTSGSTRQELGLIRDAANEFLSALRTGDRVAIVGFNNSQGPNGLMATVDVLSPLTDKRVILRNAIATLHTSNGTPFYDALARVADEVFRNPPADEFRGRRAVVALTDGVDSSSNSDFSEARAKLGRAGLATYFIQVSTEDYVEDRLLKDCQDDGRLTLSTKQLERFRRLFMPTAQKEDYEDFCRLGQFERMDISRRLYNLARQEMSELARGTGGKNFSAETLQEARGAFAQVANEIGMQYSLGYYPSNKARDGHYRQIKVEVRGVKDAMVRAREGYYAPKQ
ncbi:MAG TPA: VWA domain-containing protein [Pyrinomonadaceae bacterium]|nr:VWA domain-containing protein [Pyrinomonadaceae bacterium]